MVKTIGPRPEPTMPCLLGAIRKRKPQTVAEVGKMPMLARPTPHTGPTARRSLWAITRLGTTQTRAEHGGPSIAVGGRNPHYAWSSSMTRMVTCVARTPTQAAIATQKMLDTKTGTFPSMLDNSKHLKRRCQDEREIAC